MRVLFATAPWRFQELYPPQMAGGVSITGASPPLGIMYLSSCLKREGHQTGFLDGLNRELDDVMAEIKAFAPDVVGIHCTTFGWERTAHLCRVIKRELPDVITVVGGPHVTGAVLSCLEEGVDYGLTGDAEEAIVLLVAALESKGPLNGIPGLLFRSPDGKPRYYPHHFNKNLDAIPFPDYDLVDIRNYPPSVAFYNRLPSMTMMTTRGCPAQCTFCDAPSNFRLRSVDNVIEEIKYLKQRFGVRHILFYDEDLPLAKKRLHQMCERFIDERLDITWCCNSRADSIDEPTVKLMKRAGCWRILVGMETGTQELLDTVMKGVTLETLKEQVKMIRRNGMEVLGTFIFGLPGETYETGLRTIQFAIECDLDYAIFLKLTPFPGLAISNGLEKKGRLTGRWAPNMIPFVPDTMTEAELAQLSAEAIRRFYMRPSYLVRRGLRMRSWHDLERNVRGFFSFFGLQGEDYRNEPASAREAGLAG